MAMKMSENYGNRSIKWLTKIPLKKKEGQNGIVRARFDE